MSQRLSNWFPKHRLESITDGIYAVALTLLVLDLKLPAGHIINSTLFTDALYDQLPNLLTWLLSFWVILIYWEFQVRLNQCIIRIDSAILRMDMMHLGLISLLPFSTSLIGEHASHGLSVELYTLNLWLISGLAAFKTTYIERDGQLLTDDVEQGQVASLLWAAKVMFGGMTLALCLSFVVPGWNLLAILAPKLLPKRDKL